MAKEKTKVASELRQLDGVGEVMCEKLSEAGISTLMSLATCSPSEVADTAGMSEANARKIIKAAREELKLGFEKAADYSKKRDAVKNISTGCKELDRILGGGFESSAITEVYGRTASGKTQISHLMLVKTIQTDKHSKAIYIDSESTFRVERIKDFCDANKVDYDDAMNRIFVARSYNTDHQLLLVDEIEKILQKDNTYKIIVIDSLTSHFRANYSGRGELADRQQKLNKHLHQLLRLADLYNLVIIITNQVQSDPGMMYGNPEKPIGGNIMSHAATNILYLRPGKSGTYVAKLVDSPSLPQDECVYLITKEGIVDV